jgi:uncharacterized membrane protein
VIPSRSRGEREAARLEAFSDGVMAVIITIMALSLELPHGTGFKALGGRPLSSLLVYILSFVYIGIYWNNHHHLLRATDRISGAVMWTNLYLLFWLSLVPWLTRWVAVDYRAHLPACAYGVAALGAATAYQVLVRMIVRCNGADSAVARAVGSDIKGKVSIVLYWAAVGMAWITPWIAYGIYLLVALVWFVPDPRLRPAAAEDAGTV